MGDDLAAKDGIIDTKEFFGAYTLDIISTCCFGVEVCSLKNPNNEIVKCLKSINSSDFTSPKFLLLFMFPKFSTFLSKHRLVDFFDWKSLNFLTSVTKSVLDKRKSGEEFREDFIQHMVNVERDDSKTENSEDITNIRLKKTLTFDEILCTALLFLSAGYETTAQTLCFISYNLAMNPDIQQKLCEEIDHALEKYNGEINYESVNDIQYLDMVIDETQRLYPAASRLDRVCKDDYEYEGIKMKKGQIWAFSIYGVHYDPNNYSEPEKFDPERFSPENKKLRDPLTHIPFGAGPRICIAQRFALLEMKILITKILSQFKFIKCDETEENVKLNPTSPLTKPLKSIKLKVQKRS